MANLGDVLRHLVTHALGASPEDRAGMMEVVNEAYPPPVPPPAPVEEDPQAARIAELEAQLAAARAGAPPGG